MPGGFENSAMKTSFSLSSLQPSSVSLESSEHARPQERPYNSLRKKCRKDVEQESWRRSWGSREDGKDEFWAALKQNYHYLMDNNLIDSCKEARRDLLYGASPSHDWNFDQFCEQFTELDTWLSGIQETIYSKDKNVIDRNIRLNHLEEMHRKSYKRKIFNNQGGRLVAQLPKLKDEVAWRMMYLNLKWERLEQTVTPRKRSHPDHLDVCIDVERELRYLRKWIKQTESRLQPVDFHATWTLAELEEKAKEHEVLQRNVESHGKIVCSVLKLCEKVSCAEQQSSSSSDTAAAGAASSSSRVGGGGSGEPCQAERFARRLERRWQLLYLRSLEWVCHIDDLTNRIKNQRSLTVSSLDSDEEPVLKHPRLSEEGWADTTTDDVSGDNLMEVSICSTDDMVGPDEVSITQTPASPLALPLNNNNNNNNNIGNSSSSESTTAFNKNNNQRSGSMQGGLQLPASGAEEDDVIIDNFTPSAGKTSHVVLQRRQSIPPDTARKLFLDEISRFTRSHRASNNNATYYFKHPDTDSEQGGGGGVPSSEGDKCAVESSLSSEEEWTYNCGTVQEAATEDANVISEDSVVGADVKLEDQQQEPMSVVVENEPKPVTRPEPILRSSKETIQRLVNKAEEMVVAATTGSPRKSRVFEPLRINEVVPGSKTKRVREWLKHQLHDDDDDVKVQPVGDSCDASGEYTTEEDDLERQSSGDFNATVVNCHQSSEVVPGDYDGTILPEKPSPSTLVPNTPEHTKVVMRLPKRREGTPVRPWSVSEISQLAGTAGIQKLPQFCSTKSKSSSESALHQLALTQHSSKMDTSIQGTLSSSTTVEETTGHMHEGSGGGYSSNSLRRRKVRPRKRNLGRKSESGSDGLSPHESPSSVKAAAQSRRVPASGSETEEDAAVEGSSRPPCRKNLTLPRFRLGPESKVTVSVFNSEKLMSADSSFSEQAWDNYQEKYMSEAYSEETADNEAARRLMEFGDDYRNFLDSQSDCASSLSVGRGPAVNYRRRRPLRGGDSSVLDSDSDREEMRHVLNQSQSYLFFSERVFSQLTERSHGHLIDLGEIIATCRENVRCLRGLLEGIEDVQSAKKSGAHDSSNVQEECHCVRVLIERWENLEGRVDMQRMCALQKEMTALRDEMVHLSSRMATMQNDSMDDRSQLEVRIQQLKKELSGLRERKSQLLQVNIAVHKFLNDTTHPAAVLKDDVTDLYRVWDDTYQRVSQQLNSMQKLSSDWQQFDIHLAELQVALRGDHETLRMLDSALKGGSVSPDVATSMRDVAKVLSEKQDICCQNTCVLNDVAPGLLSAPVSTEGSLSDSGISDSGSEQDLSERERRLAALRRLARHLEAVLAPGSQAINDMAKRIEQTENELRDLQQTCRELIVRTAVCAEAKGQQRKTSSTNTGTDHPDSQKNSLSNRRSKGSSADMLGGDPDDPDSDKPSSWLWRVIRAALPFQMAIMAIFCVACLLEPHCCDSMNNLNYSLTPQLRYIRGPPPV